MIDGQENKPLILIIKKNKKKINWNVYTSIDRIQNSYTDKNILEKYLFKNYDELIDYPMLMGNYSCYLFKVYDMLHKIVFAGELPHNLNINKIIDDIKKICEQQIYFFDKNHRGASFLDSNNCYLFIILIRDCGSGGLEHRASSTIMIDFKSLPISNQIESNQYIDFLSIISHEYFHSWNIKRIKPNAFINYDFQKPNLTKLLWLFEGFTSYYESIFLLKAGIISYDQYLEILSRYINKLLKNPGRFKQSLSDSSFDAWIKYYKPDENSINSSVSYYTKGALVALGFDAEIRQNSEKSLDDVMRFIWRTYGKNFYNNSVKIGILEDQINNIITTVTGIDFKDFIKKYIDGVVEIPIEKWLAVFNIDLKWLSKSNISIEALGIILNQINGEVIVYSVLEGSIGMKYGISCGDILLAINYYRIKSIDDINNLLLQYEENNVLKIHLFHLNKIKRIHLKLNKNIFIKKCFLLKSI